MRPLQNFFLLPLTIIATFASFFISCLPSSVFASTIVSGAIAQNTTWIQAQSPYVVQSTVFVNQGVTLTIDPGVVIKFRTNLTQLYVDGTLAVNGTATDKVYFTSYKDDSVGGDTNGDGTATSPLPKDWADIRFNTGSTATITHAVVRYGGDRACTNWGCAASQSGLYNNGGVVTVSDSQFSYNNLAGIIQYNGSISIALSEIDHHANGLFLNPGGIAAISNSNFHDNSYGVTTSSSGSLTLTDNTFVNNASGAAFIKGYVNFTHSGNTASGTGRKAFVVSINVGSDTVWNNDLPYIIPSSIIDAGKILTIDPGVVIKFENLNSFLTVNGTLNINGAKTDPVFLTSVNDDLAGGDTNGNGSTTVPIHGDWKHLQFNAGSTGNLNYAIIRYGGGFNQVFQSGSYAGIYNKGGTINISHSEIDHNGSYNNFFGIRQDSGNLTINDSSIHDNSRYGIVNNSLGSPIQAINNWWGDATGPYHPLLNAQGRGNPVSDNVNFIPWLGYDPTKQPVPRDPVIIIPGILGSSQKNGVWVIDPIFHTYDDLIATLEANGYVDGKDLFTFAYDWHKSNITTALQLRDKINDVQTICQCPKVDLVAHSMGGLIARQYIQSGEYENDVDQLIFLGTPHLGSPDAYLMWEGGEVGTNTGGSLQKIEDQFLRFALSKEAKKSRFASLFDYVRNKPISSVGELLPIYDYLRDKSSGDLRIYPANYPQNTFLENLKIGILNLFDRVKITNIVGELGDASTLNVIKVVDSPKLPLWEYGYPDGFGGSTPEVGFEFGFGDGTVPSYSSSFINSDLHQLTARHRALPTKAEGLVFKKLTGQNVAILITSNTDSFLDINYKLLIIKLLSPVDVVVTAPDGKRIGKDFQTNAEVNEIGGAFYSGFLTDDEYITIPNPLDGQYKIEVQGTGTGEYTVASGYISNSVSAEKDFTAQTKPGMVSELDLSVDNTNQSLSIKPKDITPPDITVSSPQSKNYLRSEILPINVSIEDAESDIASSEIKFDDRLVHSGDNIDLFFEALGKHNVTVNASDFVGNATSTNVYFRVITTLESVISDIERAFTLGWIDNKGIKESLIQKIRAASASSPSVGEVRRGRDNVLAKAFLNELEAQRNKHVNEQAYQLLKEDINWLLNN